MNERFLSAFRGKRILVTGGTGSIGGEIVAQLLRYEPGVVRILSRNENNQFQAWNRLRHHGNVRFLLGDIRDKERLARAVEGVDLVFHAAALKHVPLCEYNPFEAVRTNVLGTQNLIEVSLDHDVERLVAINTDKSVSPINTMGATKLLAEKLIGAASLYKGPHPTICANVRFGNVIGSNGSVLPLFVEQVRRGGPLTVTDPEMVRFFMTIPQAVTLVLEAALRATGGETFILKMPVMRVIDLAHVVAELLAPGVEIPILTTGIRPGEKLHEELMTEEEALIAEEFEDMFMVRPWGTPPDVGVSAPLSTRHATLMTRDEIKDYLIRHRLIEPVRSNVALVA
ncbi:MAG: UDP-N-acetylglucosamine 4,6-dehydratase family protein [bacterium]